MTARKTARRLAQIASQSGPLPTRAAIIKAAEAADRRLREACLRLRAAAKKPNPAP